MSDDDGMRLTREILGDADAVTRLTESLASLESGDPGVDLATVRQDLARRLRTGR